MGSSHTLDQLDSCFDDTPRRRQRRSAAGCHPGRAARIEQAADALIDLGERAGAHRPGRKLLTLVHTMIAGGNCIDDADLLRWVAAIGLGVRQELVVAKTLRRILLNLPGRLTRSARRLVLHLPAGWPWAPSAGWPWAPSAGWPWAPWVGLTLARLRCVAYATRPTLRLQARLQTHPVSVSLPGGGQGAGCSLMIAADQPTTASLMRHLPQTSLLRPAQPYPSSSGIPARWIQARISA